MMSGFDDNTSDIQGRNCSRSADTRIAWGEADAQVPTALADKPLDRFFIRPNHAKTTHQAPVATP
jgi:hypothetical protein